MYDIVFIHIPYGRSISAIQEKRFYQVYWRRFKQIMPVQNAGMLDIYSVLEPPLWVAHLGAVLEQEGYEIAVIDLQTLRFREESYSEDSIKAELLRHPTNIIALSSFTINLSEALEVAKIFKQLNPDGRVIMGGPHATAEDIGCVMTGLIDIVVRGEGEEVLPLVTDALLAGKSLRSVPGLTYLDGEVPLRTSPAKGILNLDGLPMPAFHVLDKLYGEKAPFGRLYTSRGCPFKCSFCASGKRDYRQKSVERIIAELRLMRRTFGFDAYFIGDDTFIFNPATEAIVKALGEEGIIWMCQTRADQANEELFRSMARANCKLVCLGAESQDDNLLRKINKGIGINQVRDACIAAKRQGLHVLTYWMVGIPDESRETAFATQEYVQDLISSRITDLVEYSICVPYPGTDLYRDPDHYQIRLASEISKLG